MPHSIGRREEGRARILASAGRGFRRHGYEGLGVDGLAKEAGVTSGAFYAHFKSKAAAFRDAIVAGMEELRAGITSMREMHGPAWVGAFINFYLGDRRTCDLANSCALQSLTGDVARSDEGARGAFEAELIKVIEAASVGNDGVPRAQMIAILALLTGGVSLARAIRSPALSDEIAQAVCTAAKRLA